MPAAQDHCLYVVTGGPGSGKSTLIRGLADLGFATSSEVGRAIIRDQLATGGSALPWSDPAGFAELMLRWELRSYRVARQAGEATVFDRGLPDVAGYLRLCGLPVPPHVDRAARAFRYHRLVFIAPPWPEIFTQDSERRQTAEEAAATYDAMVETYSDYGYELLRLPLASVAERLRFVTGYIERRSGLRGSGRA